MSKTNTDSTYRLLAELREFVSELHEQGAFDVTTRDELMSEVSS